MEDFLWGLKINDDLTMSLIGKTTVVGLGIATIGFLCNVAYNYLRSGASNLFGQEEPFPDMMDIARCIVLFLCLSLYTPIAKTIVGTLEAINQTSALTADTQQEWAQVFEYYKEKEQKSLGEKGALEDAVKKGGANKAAAQNELNKIEQHEADKNAVNNEEIKASLSELCGYLNPTNLGIALLHAVAWAIGGIIQLVVMGFATVALKVMIILGPFVFGFSMLPVFRRQINVWFGSVCSLGIAFTVINIMNCIMWKLFKDMWNFDLNNPAASTFGAAEMIPIDLAMIGCYCSVFWLSSKIVGHRDMGQLASKTMALLSSAAMIAAGGAAAAKGLGAAGNVGQAASAGKSIIKGE